MIARPASLFDWEFGSRSRTRRGRRLRDWQRIEKFSVGFHVVFTENAEITTKRAERQDGVCVSCVLKDVDRECDPGYVDTTYKTQNLTGVLTLSGPDLNLGPQRDTRLITP